MLVHISRAAMPPTRMDQFHSAIILDLVLLHRIVRRKTVVTAVCTCKSFFLRLIFVRNLLYFIRTLFLVKASTKTPARPETAAFLPTTTMAPFPSATSRGPALSRIP